MAIITLYDSEEKEEKREIQQRKESLLNACVISTNKKKRGQETVKHRLWERS